MGIDFRNPQPLHKQIHQDLVNNIQVGNLKVGDKLKTQYELVKKYDVSLITVKRALSDLINEGILYARVGKGTFVALSSGWGRSTSAGVAPYCASKFAVEGLIGALSQDLPDGVSAVALSPGVVHTDMLTRAFGAQEASHAVDPAQWAAGAVEFLLSLGPVCNGQSLSFER